MNTLRQRLFDINGFEGSLISSKLLIKNDADMIAGMGSVSLLPDRVPQALIG